LHHQVLLNSLKLGGQGLNLGKVGIASGGNDKITHIFVWCGRLLEAAADAPVVSPVDLLTLDRAVLSLFTAHAPLGGCRSADQAQTCLS
jgi:hypothetical protein